MKSKISSIVGLWIGILLAAGCMTGCGSEESAGSTGDSGPIQKEEKEEKNEEKNDYDLAAEQWKEAGKTEDSQGTWTLMEYRDNLGGKAPDKGMTKGRDTGVLDGSDYYILEDYLKWGQTGKGTQRYYLNRVDMTTLENVRTELLLEEGSGVQEGISEQVRSLAEDLEEGWANICGMDVCEGQVCLLIAQMNRDKSGPAHCYAVRLDGEQKVESMTDLLPELERAGMYRDNVMPGGILCDREGHFYIGTGEYGIFDDTGEFLKMVEAPGGTGSIAFCSGRLPDGRPVFESAVEDGKIVIFCIEDLREKVLYRGKCEYASARYLNEKGEIFYAGSGGLLRWDGVTGKQERIYRDSGLNPLECQAITQTAEDTIVMAFGSGGETFLLKLQRDGLLEEKEVTVYHLGRNLEKLADEYSRKHPGIKIKLVNVKETEDDKSTALNRLMARITAGENPDLFLVQSEELAILQDKGLLADLREVLPRELLDQIFPGVLEGGSVDGVLYGMANEASVNTMLISERVWTEETWSFRDVMALAQGADGSGGYDVVFGGETASDLLYEMILRDITAGNSSIVDWENKECYFDSEEFIEVLEFCRKYGWDPKSSEGMSDDDIVKGMREGNILALRVEGDLGHFSRMLAALGEGFRSVGFPTEGSYGGYISCNQYLAVNAAGENREEAADFIQYVLSDPVQREQGVRSVRRDVLTENVEDGTKGASGVGSYEYPVFRCAARSIIPLEGKPDGSSFLPEYLEIVEKASPMSSWLDTLGTMVIEDAAAYFEGDKTAEEAADVIQSRVWLYLNE